MSIYIGGRQVLSSAARRSGGGMGRKRMICAGLALAGAMAAAGAGHAEETATGPIGHVPLSRLGLWVQVEERGAAAGYWQGQLIQQFDQFDSTVGSLVSDEASLQLDKMKAMGVTTITYELRTADPDTAPSCPTSQTQFPSCEVCYVLGLDWPQPTTTELTNLKSFFDLVASKGMKVDLLLTTTHMEEAPPSNANSLSWFGAIFGVVAGHAALDLILFGGDANRISTTACGSQGGEPPLWLGPGSYAATFLKWMIPFAMTNGIGASQLSAESVVGDFLLESQAPAGANATNHHLWSPLKVMAGIFNALKIPKAQRTYAMSFYERHKCSDAGSLKCTNLDPHDWASQSLTKAIAEIGGAAHRGQLLLTEGGTLEPDKWPAQFAFESLGFLMQKDGLPGGNFWRWAAFTTSEDADATTESGGRPVKMRGTDFVYFPPQLEIVDLGGFHLAAISNGSFEEGVKNKAPASWTVSGDGTGSKYFLAGEPDEPQVPSRGKYDLRLVTGADASAAVTASSATIAVSPSTAYTTTGNLRFAWSGDPDPSGDPTTRPQVFIAFNYFSSAGAPSAVKTQDIFRFFEEDSTTDFQTFPLQYTTPSDATLLQIVIGAARNGLPTPITFDADNLR
jgi:hypothetical protein